MKLLGFAGRRGLIELIEFAEVALGSELGDMRRIHGNAIERDDGSA